MWLLQVWRYYLLPSEEQRLPLVKNPMCQTFPRIGPYSLIMVKNPKNQNNTPSAACNYWRWGGSGGQENINAICILGLNIVNDKVRGWQTTSLSSSRTISWEPNLDIYQVFLVLWWWFLLLLIIGFVRLLYRAIQCRCWFRFHSRPKKEEKKNPRSAWLRYHLLTMRLYQNFKKSTKVDLQKKCERKN